MPTNVDNIIRKLPASRRNKIERRAAQLISEEMTRQQLRIALKRTQADVAKKLGINQDSVSRLEQRADVLISSLRAYIEALGGDLGLVARFPDQPPVELCGIAEGNVHSLTPKHRKLAKIFA